MCCLQPLQLSQLSPTSAQISRLCVLTMAMFSTASLFSVVLLAFVKHADGMRGPPQPTSMVATEVTSWGKDPCEKVGAKTDVKWKAPNIDFLQCKCPEDRPRTTMECGHGDITFRLSTASKGCRCVTEAELKQAMP